VEPGKMPGKLVFLTALAAIGAMATVYAFKAQAIRNYTLSVTDRAYGKDSAVYRASRQFTDNNYYLLSFRVVALIVAGAAFGFLIYCAPLPFTPA
jgi:hypothetical protein